MAPSKGSFSMLYVRTRNLLHFCIFHRWEEKSCPHYHWYLYSSWVNSLQQKHISLHHMNNKSARNIPDTIYVRVRWRTREVIKVDVRAVQIHLPNEADEGNDLVQLLDAAEDVSDYWTRKNGPQPKHLHVLVQKPSGAPSRSLVASTHPSDLHLIHRSLLIPTFNLHSSRYVITSSSLNHI